MNDDVVVWFGPDRLFELLVPVDELTELEVNPRRGEVEKIAASYTRLGQRKPIVAQQRGEDLVVVDGNHQLRAVRELGWTHIAVAPADDLSLEEATAYAVAANQLGRVGSIDEADLGALLAEIEDDDLLVVTGYDENELDRLLGEVLGGDDPGGGGEPPPVREETVSALGDVWSLGEGRVVCGSSADPEVLALALNGRSAGVVWTDPPYGVDYVGKTEEALTIEGDGRGSVLDLLYDVFPAALDVCEPGASWWVCSPPGPDVEPFVVVLNELDILRQGLVWVKDSLVLGRSDYHYRHEPIWYGWVPGGSHTAPGDRSQTSVLEFDRPKASRDHPTMKPLDLIEYCLSNSSPGVVLDMFGGSGSTAIAARRQGRAAALVELDPKYVDVICRRWFAETGEVPVNEVTGEVFPVDGGDNEG